MVYTASLGSSPPVVRRYRAHRDSDSPCDFCIGELVSDSFKTPGTYSPSLGSSRPGPGVPYSMGSRGFGTRALDFHGSIGYA